MEKITIKLSDNDINKRIDNFLKKKYKKLSIFVIQKMIRIGDVKVNNKKVNNNYHLQQNDIINLFIDNNKLSNKEDENDFLNVSSKLDIVFEDKNIMIINKPIGLICQPDKNTLVDTLSNRIKKYLYEKKEWDYKNENTFVPSLIHRLDKNTSGLIIAAKNASTLAILNQKIKDHEIDKYYLCLVNGLVKPKEKLCNAYLLKQENIVKIFPSKVFNSSPISTFYRVIEYIKNKYSLLEIKLITGKTHQIRAHMNFLGYPLVNEHKYTNEIVEKDEKKYQSLVSYKIIFNFKTDAGILNYLNKQTFELKNAFSILKI